MVHISTLLSTLGDVQAHIRNLNLPPQKRRYFVSGLNRFAVGVDVPLNNIPATAEGIAHALGLANPAAADIGDANWRNIVSGVMAAMRAVGIDIKPMHDTDPMSPAWTIRHDRLPPHTYSLSRAFRHFTRIGVEPENVQPAAFDNFTRALHRDYGIKNAPLRDREARKTWNKCVDTLDGWPQVKVPVPDNRRDVGTPAWDDLPDTLAAEKTAFLDFRARPYLNDEDHAVDLKPLRPSSLAKLDYSLRQAAGMMRQGGIALSSLTGLAAMVQPAAFKVCRDTLMKKHNQKPNSQAWNIMCALTGVATTWVYKNEDHPEVKRLQKLAKKLKPHYEGMTEKNKQRLRKAIEPDNFRKLARLPKVLAAMARDPGTPSVTAAHLMEMAVAIRLLLVVAPVRVATLAKTLVGIHMFGAKPDLGGDVTLHYPENLVKNSVELDFGVDPETVALVREYMRDFRPHLAYGHPQALFPGKAGDTKGESTLAKQITKTIRQHTGLDFNVHLFRHLTGFLYLCRHPGDYLAVQKALGHKNLRTTMTFYVWMETDKLVRQYQQTMLSAVEAA